EKQRFLSLQLREAFAIVCRLSAQNSATIERLEHALPLPGDVCARMINYTERLTLLMQDIVAKVPTLSFIDVADVLVFARSGRSTAEGAFATCHCLTLPASEPGYYFWRDRTTQRITRRSEWFVTKSPEVTLGTRPVRYLISFALP